MCGHHDVPWRWEPPATPQLQNEACHVCTMKANLGPRDTTKCKECSGKLGRLAVVSRPFQRVSIDLLKMGMSLRGNCRWLIVIDHLTNYLKVVALPDGKAQQSPRTRQAAQSGMSINLNPATVCASDTLVMTSCRSVSVTLTAHQLYQETLRLSEILASINEAMICASP